ncbi:guanylate-binding protein 1-like isoform X1 [Tympanuchus pallidicinctus]|uniref:guanylate-binding protein 1-like isoform X1 n=1 Tax=Tympanuchus pallidicinctus TaxID=109042 RepID=UPI0022875E9A|nr:guanylate-binding protein 1-like isoform X1 [Tympanuchus pallidicinctus]
MLCGPCPLPCTWWRRWGRPTGAPCSSWSSCRDRAAASPAALGCGCGDARTPSGPTVNCCCCTPEDSSGARNRRMAPGCGSSCCSCCWAACWFMAVVTAMVTHRNSSSSSRILCSGCGPFPPLGLSCLFSCFPSLLSYAQKLPHHLRLLEEEEDEEDEDHLLRFVLPPFVWSLCSTAQAPEDEELLGDEDHKLEPALRGPPGPVARCVLTLFPEQKLFRVSESSAEGLTQLCTHLLGCDPKTEPGGAEVGGAYLAALAERVVNAMQEDTVLRIGRLCQEAKEMAQQETGDKWPTATNFWQDDTFLGNTDTSDTIPQHDDIPQASTSPRHDDTDGDTTQQQEDAAWVEAPSPHPLSPMPAPLCLVYNSDNNKPSLNPKALAVLRGITQPLVVVAIAGPYRTGKSFLMNRLAQRRTGFPLSPTVRAETKGIWMWCLPHPRRRDVALVLLDTEGLGDPQKGDNSNDAWIFSLAVLLSSTLVYNSMCTINQQALDQLRLVTELTNHIRVRVEDEDPATEFSRVFPSFVWVVRDFTLQLRDGERVLTEDEYLEDALLLKSGNGRVVQEHNELRRCLRDFFINRKLFVLERPTANANLAQLEEMQEDELQPCFRQQAAAFCQHIWEKAPVKELPGGRQVTGTMLASLVEKYVAAIVKGKVPCVESAVTALARTENTAAVAAAVAEYQKGMEQDLVLPTDSRATLVDVHQRWERRAVTLFLSCAFADNERTYQCQLMRELEAAKEEFCLRNEEASEQRCQAVLRELWQDVEHRLQCGDYAAPGGAQLFQDDLCHVLEKYQWWPEKGVKADAVLDVFLRDREPLAQALHAVDARMMMMEWQKEAAAAKEAAAREAEAECLKEQQRSLEEHCRQLEQQLLEEQRLRLKEQNRLLEHHLKEHRALIEEGYKRDAEKMQLQIERLREEKQRTENHTWVVSAVGLLVEVASLFLPGMVVKTAGIVGKLMKRIL